MDRAGRSNLLALEGVRVRVLGMWVEGLGFRPSGLGFRDYGSGFEGLGFQGLLRLRWDSVEIADFGIAHAACQI